MTKILVIAFEDENQALTVLRSIKMLEDDGLSNQSGVKVILRDVDGYVNRENISEMSCAVPAEQANETLTERESEVLRLLAMGKTDQEIAKKLVIADVTIRTHVCRILSKLGLKNRVQAVLYSIHSGMISLDEAYEEAVNHNEPCMV